MLTFDNIFDDITEYRVDSALLLKRSDLAIAIREILDEHKLAQSEEFWAALMDRLDDIELVAIAKARDGQPEIKVCPEDL